jgi:predicted transcriptional regulator
MNINDSIALEPQCISSASDEPRAENPDRGQMCVSNYMTKELMVISHHATIRDAVRHIHIKDASILVVLDDEGRTLGYVTEHDIVNMCKGISPFLGNFEEIYEQMFLAKSERIGVEVLVRLLDIMNNYTVEQIMSKGSGSINPDDPILKANKMMSDMRVDSLPVMDDEGRLKGVITRQAIVQACFLWMHLFINKEVNGSKTQFRKINLALSS